MRKLMIDEAALVLKNGGVVVLPTDTVWGAAAAISSREGIEKLYRVMERPWSKPTAVLVGGVEMAKTYAKVEGKAEELMRRYWPGGLTVVVEAREAVPKMIMGGSGKVGLRAARHNAVSELINRLGEGLVASSANVGGGKTPTRFEEIEKSFLAALDGVIEGEASGSRASSVVEVRGSEVIILREGELAVE